MGMVEAVTHSLVANGAGSTRITLSYARDHREKVEFFGEDIVENRRRRKIYREIRRRMTSREREGLLAAANVQTAAGAAFLESSQQIHNQGLAQLAENPQAASAALGMAQDMLGMAQSSVSVSEALRSLIRTGTFPDQELVTTKKWTVACLASSLPQVGSTGPWGGPIKEARDITDQFVSRSATTPPGQQEIRAIDEQLESLDVQRTMLRQELQARSLGMPYTAPEEVVDTELASIDAQVASLQSRRGSLSSERTTHFRRLTLFGAFNSGQRMPPANIPPHFIGVATPAHVIGPSITSITGDPNVMVTLLAYELTEDITQGSDETDYAVEDIVRPPWFPQVWMNGSIGGGVYLPLLGTGAITDPIAVLAPGTLSDMSGMTNDAVTNMLQSVASGTDASAQVINSIMDGATVQGAVDFLVHTYSLMQNKGVDITEFVKTYCWRPIATMFDIFGSRDLMMKADGTVEQGVMGFHSHSFGPYADLFGIAPTDTTKLLGIDETDVAARARLDVRGRRHAVIMAYRDELSYRRITKG